MRIEIGKDWCISKARKEESSGIGAGLLAADPVFDGEPEAAVVADDSELNIAFGRFVSLMRRRRGATLEKLAEDADVDIVHLVEIEGDPHHKPEPRTVYQLANYFDVPRPNLMQIAGLIVPKDSNLYAEAVRFAARSEPTEDLSPEEQAALDAFVAVLSEQK